MSQSNANSVIGQKIIVRIESIQILKGVVFNLVAKIYGASSYEKISLSRNYFKDCFNCPVLTNIKYSEVKSYTCMFGLSLGLVGKEVSSRIRVWSSFCLCLQCQSSLRDLLIARRI
jgi:hypothetical protein